MLNGLHRRFAKGSPNFRISFGGRLPGDSLREFRISAHPLTHRFAERLLALLLPVRDNFRELFALSWGEAQVLKKSGINAAGRDREQDRLLSSAGRGVRVGG